MLPLTLDVAAWRVILVGDGRAALARLAMLEAAGARDLAVFAKDPSPALAARAGARLIPRLPRKSEIIAARLMMTAGLSEALSARLCAIARAHRVLVNAEDIPPLCDAYALAMVRRGNLVIAISTEGRSPAFARGLRQWLECRFGPEWEDHLEAAATMREAMRAKGAAPPAIMAATSALLGEWLAGAPPEG